MHFYSFLITIALLGIVTQSYFQLRDYYKKNLESLAVKMCGTLIPVLLCLYALLTADTPAWKWLLFAGLFLCMAADGVIGIRFTAGMLVFLAAHLCFIAYFLKLAPFHGISVFFFFLFVSCAASAFMRRISSLGAGLIPPALYAVVLAGMTSVAVALPFSVWGTGPVCIAAGGLLFFISDFLLVWNTLETPSPFLDRLSLYLYYSSVYLLGVSAFYFS